MSLDLYIYSKTPVLHRGTGVYIRDNGETKELTTKQEVLTYFPDVNPDDIEEKTYEDNTYFHINIWKDTYSVRFTMASKGNYEYRRTYYGICRGTYIML